MLLALIDTLISSFVILPLVVSFWRGTWDFIHYSHLFPISWTLYISLVFHVAFTLLREPLYEQRKSGLFGLVTSRIYIYLFAVVSITQWRAFFALIEETVSLRTECILAGSSVLILMGIKGLGTIIGPPFVIFMDHKQKDVFIYPTMFSKNSTGNLWIYFMDCAFSVCVIGTLVVFVWRGTWSLLDHYLYPKDSVLSAWASLGLGYCIVALVFLFQPPIKYLAKELSGFPRMLAVDLYLLFSFCGTVNVWRGIWNLLTVYLFPNNPPLSFAISHVVPFLLLVLINSSNSILVRGVYIDGEETGSKCVDFPCYYLRLFFQVKRQKKLLREAAKRQTERRKSEAENLVQVGVIQIESEKWKKSPNNSIQETNQLLTSP